MVAEAWSIVEAGTLMGASSWCMDRFQRNRGARPIHVEFVHCDICSSTSIVIIKIIYTGFCDLCSIVFIVRFLQ